MHVYKFQLNLRYLTAIELFIFFIPFFLAFCSNCMFLLDLNRNEIITINQFFQHRVRNIDVNVHSSCLSVCKYLTKFVFAKHSEAAWKKINTCLFEPTFKFNSTFNNVLNYDYNNASIKALVLWIISQIYSTATGICRQCWNMHLFKFAKHCLGWWSRIVDYLFVLYKCTMYNVHSHTS